MGVMLGLKTLMDLRSVKIGTLLGVGIVAIIVLMIVPIIYSNSLSTRAQNIISDSTERIFEAMTIQRDVDELFSAADQLVFALEEREVLTTKMQLDQLLNRLQTNVEAGKQQQIFTVSEIERTEAHVQAIADVSAKIIRLKEASRQVGPEEAGLFVELNQLRAARYGLLAVVTEVIQRSDEEFRNATQLVARSQALAWIAVGVSLIVAMGLGYFLVRATRKIFDLKNEFINIIAHDLRNPVTAIIGYLDIIATDKEMKQAEMRKQLKIIEVATHRLRNQINNLLEVGRSEAGYTKVELGPTQVAGVLHGSVKRAEAFAATQRKTIAPMKPVSEDVVVLADKHKLADVFDNLISNAIKYNREDGVVTILTHDDEKTFSVSVTDEGPGIPADQQDKIFKKYTRLAESSKERVGGTGLGLYTVKLAMDQMRGTVSFTSEQGRGTTFTVSLQKQLPSS